MKKFVFTLGLVLAFGATADMKIGTIDLMLLVRNHPNYDSNKELLSTTDKDFQKKLESIKAEGEKLQEDGKKLADQARNPMLAVKAKAEIEKKLVDLQQKLIGIEQRYRSEAMRCRQDLQELEARLLKTTTDDLRKRIGKFAEENGYDFVLDKTAALYGKPEFDVTEEVLSAMGVKEIKGKDESK